MPCDYKKYVQNWKTVIRPDILKRAHNRCEQCGVKNGELVLRGTWNGKEVYQDMDGTIWDGNNYCNRIGDDYVGEVDNEMKNDFIKIVLTIAHIDHNCENNDYSNLKALCQLHHLRLDLQQHKKSSRATRNKNRGLQELF